MITIEPAASLGDLVAERPARSRVFDRLGLDYCCGGRLSLAEACRRRGLDVPAVLAEIESSDERGAPAPGPDPRGLGLAELADLIEETHHVYLRENFQRISALLERVIHAHAAKDPRLAQLGGVFSRLRSDLEIHLLKEENILFPMIRSLAAGKNPAGGCAKGLEGPLACMHSEHEAAGQGLAAIRGLTEDFAVPAWACGTYRALLDALSDLDRDVRMHIHKENNLLFPKAQAQETRLVQRH